MTKGRTIKLDSRVRVRFAPSPTGSLHIGSARTALFNFLFARHAGLTGADARFVLRVEDTDAARSEPRFEEAILADLRWLGLDWDEGPGRNGPFGPYRQSERLERYREAAGVLVAGGLAYHCFCTAERLEALRAERLAAGLMPKYDRRCLRLPSGEVESRRASGEPSVVRLRVPDGEIVVDDLVRGPVHFASDVIGDFIVLRSDGVAGYNFAAAVDDRDMEITHVIRGDDHLTNTARQQLIFAAIGAPPPHYAHHALILGGDGGKLSKRHGATSVGEFRELGYLPEAIVNYLALLSWSHGEDEVLGMNRLIADFELERLSASAAVFDQAKLDWLDHEHILATDPDEHARRFAARLPSDTPAQAAAALAAAYQPSLVAYGEAPALAAAVLTPPVLPSALTTIVQGAAATLGAFRALRGGAPDWIASEAARELLARYRAWGKDRGLAARDVLMPLRVALTGSEHGPELHYVLASLSATDTLARIDAALVAAGATPAKGDTT